jgi:hypothetical protein
VAPVAACPGGHGRVADFGEQFRGLAKDVGWLGLAGGHNETVPGDQVELLDRSPPLLGEHGASYLGFRELITVRRSGDSV